MNERVRYMRLVVFFDLPVGTTIQRKNYARFRKFLIKNGYLMMQESVYSKLAINDRVANGSVAKLRANRPPEGIVQVLKVTERQYATIACITGLEAASEEISGTEELIVL